MLSITNLFIPGEAYDAILQHYVYTVRLGNLKDSAFFRKSFRFFRSISGIIPEKHRKQSRKSGTFSGKKTESSKFPSQGKFYCTVSGDIFTLQQCLGEPRGEEGRICRRYKISADHPKIKCLISFFMLKSPGRIFINKFATHISC